MCGFAKPMRQAYAPANASGCDAFCVPYCFLLKVIRKSLLGAPDPAPSFFLTVSYQK